MISRRNFMIHFKNLRLHHGCFLSWSCKKLDLGPFNLSQIILRFVTAQNRFKHYSPKKNEMIWPANSPDLNPIENLWSSLDRQIAKDLPRDMNQLRTSISKYLSNVPEKIIQNLVDSMPTRIHQCIKNRCGVTKY